MAGATELRWKPLMKLRIINQTRATILADRAAIADTSATRRTGLLKSTQFVPGDGLWIDLVRSRAYFRHAVRHRSRVPEQEAPGPQDPARGPQAPDRHGSAGALRPGTSGGDAAATQTAVGDQLELEKCDG